MHEIDPEFLWNIIISDEAYFHLGDFVDKQNCCILNVWLFGAVYGPAESSL